MPLLLPYKGNLTLLPDATYLITGGLGVLGLETARWLAEKGAANLVLVGRNEGSAAAEEQVSKLRQSGVSVKVLKADVTKRADVLMVIEAISGMPPLKGIIHGAGVLSDGVLMKQDMERFHRVISPKADGAWNLHEATLGLNLDFFVCFSSVASVLGSAGQSNYAAANAFLNGFMYERRRQGLHGLSVNWGPWDLGMAAGLGNRDAERIAARGIGAISPAEGFDILEQLILHDETDAYVLPVSWDKYLRYHYQGTIPPFFQAVTEESSGNRSASEEKSAIIGKLEGTPAGQRSTVLIDYVQKQVAMVLHLKQTKRVSPDQGLFDLGIDSLMAMELKNKFEADMGRPLRPTLIFDYPTVDALASYLAEEMGMADEQSHQTTQEYRKDKGSGAVVVLSAEEINDSIADELAKLESLLKG
jgi:short-subunit dehydrogenase/acyl carrier protein